MTTDRISELDRLLEGLLATADVVGADIGLRIERSPKEILVKLGGGTTRFRTDSEDWQLQWESLAKRLIRAATDARLHRIMGGRGENRPGPWSVYATTFTIDWLVWNAGGSNTAAWQGDVETIIEAADEDDDVVIPSRRNPKRKGLRGSMRSRRLYARIDLVEATYQSLTGKLLADEILPDTVVSSDDRRPLGSYLEHPAVNGRPYELRELSVSDAGTLFALKEDWLPLETAGAASPSQATGARPPWELPTLSAKHVSGLIMRGAKGFGRSRRG